MKLPRTIILLALTTLFFSCDKRSTDVQLKAALTLAESNRPALEQVLEHYSREEDSLKYRAAVFLIKYMPGKYGIVFSNYKSYEPIFDTLASLNATYEQKARNIDLYKYYKHSVVKSLLPLKDSISQSPTYKTLEDIKTISAEFLIENIDYAFKSWEQPWAKTLTFHEFCEFILPYRYGNEELQPWRKHYYEHNITLLKDLVKDENDPVKVCNKLNQLYGKSFSEVDELKALSNAILPLDLHRINSSTSCIDQSGLGLIRMRGLGIPVAKLNVPLWGNRGSGHDLNGVLSLEKKWICFQTAESGPGVYKFPSDFFAPKVYAEIYSKTVHPTYVSLKNGSYYLDSAYVDITDDIIEHSEIPLRGDYINKETSYALCVFNNNDWIPITSSVVGDGIPIFKQIGRNIIYVTAVIGPQGIEYKGNPFLLDSNGIVRPIVPLAETSTITIDRKYPNSPWIVDKLHTIEGIEFQGSNDSSFRSRITLWKVENLQTLNHKKRHLPVSKLFKFIRVVFPLIVERNEGLADICIYDDHDNLLEGVPYSSTPAPVIFYQNVFDSNPTNYVQLLNEKYSDFGSYYDSHLLVIPDQKHFWVGLKFKVPTAIKGLGVTPRTDDNSINIGETYELLFWKGKWISAGRKIAITNELTFTAPKHALLLLKNVDKGREHRIFLFESGKQLWF